VSAVGDMPVESTGFRYCIFGVFAIALHKFNLCSGSVATGALVSALPVDYRLSTLLQPMLVYSMVVDSLDKALGVLLLSSSLFFLLRIVGSGLHSFATSRLTMWLPVCTSVDRWDSTCRLM
jgi:hypothetical protein